jgi:hypothetical protein
MGTRKGNRNGPERGTGALVDRWRPPRSWPPRSRVLHQSARRADVTRRRPARPGGTVFPVGRAWHGWRLPCARTGRIRDSSQASCGVAWSPPGTRLWGRTACDGDKLRRGVDVVVADGWHSILDACPRSPLAQVWAVNRVPPHARIEFSAPSHQKSIASGLPACGSRQASETFAPAPPRWHGGARATRRAHVPVASAAEPVRGGVQRDGLCP